MRLPKSFVCLSAIAVCAFAVCNAQTQTNNVTFNATMFVQQPLVTNLNSASIASKSVALNTGGLIAELSSAIHTNFTKAAKLAVIGGHVSQFEVIDGTNNVAIGTNIISIYSTETNMVASGMENAKTELLKEQMIFELNFNDVGVGASDLQFSLRGIGSITMTSTTSSRSTAAKMTLVGNGAIGPAAGTNIIVTATLTGSGRQ